MLKRISIGALSISAILSSASLARPAHKLNRSVVNWHLVQSLQSRSSKNKSYTSGRSRL
jgi:hypothetical protein